MTKDLTTGKIMPILVNFTVPLVLGNLLLGQSPVFHCEVFR